MSYGITVHLTSIDDIKSIWGSKITLSKRDSGIQMKIKLGFSFLARQSATDCLKRFNKEMKKEHGYLDFRSHVAMQDLFNGDISYSKTPWIYSYLLEAIAIELSINYNGIVKNDFKQKFREKYSSEHRLLEKYYEEHIEYVYSRTFIKNTYQYKTLPNSEWYPCSLSIINYLPYLLPMPIPEADDFPYVSSIYNKDLDEVFNKIDFTGFSIEAKAQMETWFNLAKKEVRDLILFIY